MCVASPGTRPSWALKRSVVTLREPEGLDGNHLRQSYDPVSTPELAAFVGRSAKGIWTLEVRDEAKADEGTLRSFALELGLSR